MTTRPPSRIQKRYDCLDGLRAVLALYVVVHHAWLGIFIQDPKALSYLFDWLAFGRDAVCFFLVLSGFCLMLPTVENGYRLTRGVAAFINRRGWRILPPYYLALGLSILIDLPNNYTVSGHGWPLILPVTQDNVLSHLLLIHNFFPADLYKINPALWSIPVEWQIYFLFPLLLFIWRRFDPMIATTVIVLGSALIERHLNLYWGTAPCVHFVGLFALGMLAACFATGEGYQSVSWKPVCCALGLLLMASVYANSQIVSDDCFGLFAALLLVAILVDPNGSVHRALNYKPLVAIGTFSYSIYLIHSLFLQSIYIYVRPHLPFGPDLQCLAFILIGLPISVAGAYLFHLACERPFLRIRERKIVHVR